MTFRRLFHPTAALLALLTLATALAVPAHAATPPPLDGVRFSFPGSVLTPANAITAGLGLADRYVDDVTSNPAARIERSVIASPQLIRVSRQDLSAANREFDQRMASIDFAGATISVPIRAMDLTLFVCQPTLRAENTSYTVGNKVSLSSPAQVTNDATLRELRGGLALGFGRGDVRLGLSADYNHRDDDYQTLEVSGSPQSGTREASFNGNAIGGGVGLTWAKHPELKHGWLFGAAVHAVGSLEATGTSVSTLLADTTKTNIDVTRDAAWQAGASARWSLSTLSGVFATVGARGPEKWDTFDVETRMASDWGLGIDYRDPETPYAFRFGIGQEVQPGAPEPRASTLGLGFSWFSGDTIFDIGILHRTLTRGDAPNSSDDRLVGSVRVKL